MKMLKKILSTFLLASMLLSTPLSAYAGDTIGINSTSEGANAAGNDPAYAHKFDAYPMNCGYRISIVDKDGDRVTNSVDIVNYAPKDMGSLPNTTGNIANITGSIGQIQKGYKEYKDYLGASKIPGDNKESLFYYSNGIKTEDFDDRTWSTGIEKGVPTGKNSKGDVIKTMMIPAGFFAKAMYDSYKTYCNENNLTPAYNSAAEFKVPMPVKIIGNTLVAGGDDLKDYLERYVDGKPRETYKGQANAPAIMAVPLLTSKTWEFDGAGNKISNNEVDLFTFVNSSEAKSKIGTVKSNGKHYSIIDAIQEYGYKVIIEPVYWYVPEVLVVKNASAYVNQLSTNRIGNLEGVCYGTVSYILKYTSKTFEDAFPSNDQENFICGPNWGSANIGLTSLMIDHNDEDLKINEPSSVLGQAYVAANGDFYTMGLLTEGDAYKTVGYSLFIYDADALVGGVTRQGTYDKVNYGPGNPNNGHYTPGPAPEKPGMPGTSKNNWIVKYYARKTPNGLAYVENHVRKDAISPIIVQDEEGYKVDNWFSSDTFKKPKSPTESYDVVKSSIPNDQNGDQPGTSVTLKDNQTLYVRLVATPRVVKIFETNGNLDKIKLEDPAKLDSNSVYTVNPQEDGYPYVEGTKSPEYRDPHFISDWMDVPDDNNVGQQTSIKLGPEETTIYLRYSKSAAGASKLVLHENEISHNYKMTDAHSAEFPGVFHFSRVEKGNHSNCYKSNGYWHSPPYSYNKSTSWSFDLTNDMNYNTHSVWQNYQYGELNGVSSGSGSNSVTHYSGTPTTYEGIGIKVTPHMNFTLSRLDKDMPTLYPEVPQGVQVNTGYVKQMGVQGESYIPAGKRNGSPDQPVRKIWQTPFTTDWQYHNINSHNSQFTDTKGCTKNPKHPVGTYDVSVFKSYDAQADIYGLWGKTNKYIKASDQWGTTGVAVQNTQVKTATAKDGYDIKFYPFYKMVYETLDHGAGGGKINNSSFNNTDYPVILTSENLSTDLGVLRIDTFTNKDKGNVNNGKGYGLNLTSTQWSMHQRVNQMFTDQGIMDHNSVLPAGAIYQLNTANGTGDGANKATPVWVGYHLYASYIEKPSTLADQANIPDGNTARTAIDTFNKQVRASLEGMEVILRGKEGIQSSQKPDDYRQLTGQALNGTPAKMQGNINFSDEAKYDLKTDAGNATNENHNGTPQRSDLDIVDEVNETIDWGIKSDADGNVVVTKDGTQVAQISKTQDVNSLYNSTEGSNIKAVDDMTAFFTNYIAAVDRNLGADRNNNTWYNEGYDYMHLIEVKQSYEMGFASSTGKTGPDAGIRSAALNIYAAGHLDNQNDLYNFEQSTLDDKARTFMFTVAKKSLNGAAASKPDFWLGDLTLGGKTISMTAPKLDELIRSKIFYTGNATVQDLS